MFLKIEGQIANTVSESVLHSTPHLLDMPSSAVLALHNDGVTFWEHCPDAFTKGADECWRWLGEYRKPPPGQEAYGLFDNEVASRVSLYIQTGIWPGKRLVCHTCDHPWCVNPSHLFLGTSSDNARDCVAKGRHAQLGRVGRNVKTNEQAVREIRASTEKISTLMERFGLHHSTIYNIKNRKAWKHVS